MSYWIKISNQAIVSLPMSTENSYPGLDVWPQDTQTPQGGQGGQEHSQREGLQSRPADQQAPVNNTQSLHTCISFTLLVTQRDAALLFHQKISW